MPFLLKRKFTKSTKKPSVEVKSTSQTKSLAPLVDEPETRPTVAGATSVSAASSVALTPSLTVETTKKRARRPLLANKAKKSVQAGASAKGRLKKQKIPRRNEIDTGEKEKDDNNPEEDRRGGRSDNVNNKGNKHELGEAVASENVEPKVQSTRGKGRRESKTNAKGTKTTSTSKAQTQTQTERKSPTKKKPKTLPKKKGRKKRKKRQDSDNEAYTSLSSPLASRSSLTSMQPTRKSTRTRGVKLDYSAFLDQPQPLTLLPCEWYASADAQPFKLRVHSSAVFMMDVHAHLTDTEIIGLLAGEYDADSHVLTIYNAYPCRSLATGLWKCLLVRRFLCVFVCVCMRILVCRRVMGEGL